MNKKILVVDDSNTIRQQLAFALTRAGYEVIEAGDGREGLNQIAGNPDIAMIICDVNMPKMNGLEMIEEIAKNKSSFAPVIMLTTEGGNELIERAKKSGAKGWLVKPFKPEQIVDVVKKLAA